MLIIYTKQTGLVIIFEFSPKLMSTVTHMSHHPWQCCLKFVCFVNISSGRVAGDSCLEEYHLRIRAIVGCVVFVTGGT